MHEIQAKSILSPRGGINVYRGCTHGCIYCDSRSTCYQMDHAFEDVAVKVNAPELLEEARRQAGAETRQMLARACAALNIPLVHGAIQGWYAQVAVIPPGCDLLDRLYPAGETAAGDKSSLAFTPALCAALQASEAVKLLCGRDSPLAGKLLCADLLNQDYEVLSLPPESV